MPGMKGTMHEFKKGTLHSGSKTGPKVTSRAQAIAIGLNDQGGTAGSAPPAKPMKKRKKKGGAKKNPYYNTMKSAGMLD